MRKRLRWLGQVPQMKDDILPNIVLLGQLSRAKRKAGTVGVGGCRKERFKGNGNFLG